jgi:hypothetical protein
MKIPPEKSLQVVAKNEIHASAIMPCSSELMDEFCNIFRIEGSYNLNYKESNFFSYWKGQKFCWMFREL